MAGTSFQYSVSEQPEATSYSGTTSVLSYTTDSLTASGPISALDLKDRRKGYSRLPGISTITTSTGTGAILKPSSTTIGKVVKTKLENIGFNYPSDLTLSPEANLPQVLELNTFFGFSRVGITSFGRGYTTPPTLIVLDGTTQKQIDDIDLRYVTGSNVVPILKNTLSLSGNNPTIRPIKNSNGIRVANLVYDDTTKSVTVTMEKTYSENFPIEVGDKILVENSVVTVDPNAAVDAITKGFNSEDYDYRLFNVTGVTANLGGGIGIVTYSFDEYSGLEESGIFDTVNSSATIVPERLFPVFNFDIKSNSFQKGSVVTSGDLEGTVADWDETNQLLTLESSDDFSVGDVIEEDVTGSKATVNVKYEFKSEYDIDYFSKVDNGWRTENGFLSKIEQRLPDNDYYQNFSYSIKSKVPFQKWNDSVSSLLHSAGFKKFSDLQVESLLPLEDEDALEIIPTDATSIQIDLVNVYDLECVANFDLVTENYIGGANNKYSDEITFKTRIISDFTESISNRVLLIDDISGQFNSNARGTPYQEVNRHRLEDAIGAKFVILVKDKLFTGERQVSLVSVINNVHTGESMINQYGDIDTELELGSFDYVIDGTDGVLNFYPDKFEVNNYNLSVFSYNLERLDIRFRYDWYWINSNWSINHFRIPRCFSKSCNHKSCHCWCCCNNSLYSCWNWNYYLWN